jgi:hypothetical protein
MTVRIRVRACLLSMSASGTIDSSDSSSASAKNSHTT